MLNKLGIKLIRWLVGRNLTLEQRNEIVVHILDNLQALPVSGIITVNDDGQLLINNRSLDIEKIKQLRESARAAQDNVALKVVNHEVLYTAVVGGIHKSMTPEDMYFYRAAIWYGQQQQIQLALLAQRQMEQE